MNAIRAGSRSAPAIAALLVLLMAACSPGGGSPVPTPNPSPTPGTRLTIAQVKFALIERLGDLWYCDRDFYPVAHDDEAALALQRFPEVQADSEAFAAIVEKLDLDAGDTFSDADKLAIYRAWKVLAAIALESIGEGRYRFDYLAQPAPGAAEGTRTAGLIDDRGTITVEQQAPTGEPMCPICLAEGTTIDTPAGPVAVERLRLGDAVWTLDASGRQVAGTVIALGSTPAPVGHEVIRLALRDGRSVTASPGHPLGDGRELGDLRIGDLVDGSAVVALDVLPYVGAETFDIVVSGPSGTYLAGGIPLGTTLR